MKSGTLLKGQFLGETAHLGRDDLGRGQANSRSALAINRLFHPQVEFWNVKHLFSFLLWVFWYKSTVFQSNCVDIPEIEKTQCCYPRISENVCMAGLNCCYNGADITGISCYHPRGRKTFWESPCSKKSPCSKFPSQLQRVWYGPYHMDHSLWT